jgi:hypothetical protein
VGTYDSRWRSRGADAFLGGYPLQAVAVDLTYLASSFGRMEGSHWSGSERFTFSLLSLPADAILDLVLLPADLVAWLFGHQKRSISPP